MCIIVVDIAGTYDGDLKAGKGKLISGMLWDAVSLGAANELWLHGSTWL